MATSLSMTTPQTQGLVERLEAYCHQMIPLRLDYLEHRGAGQAEINALSQRRSDILSLIAELRSLASRNEGLEEGALLATIALGNLERVVRYVLSKNLHDASFKELAEDALAGAAKARQALSPEEGG